MVARGGETLSDYIDRERAIQDVQAWATNLNDPKMLVREDAICVLQNIPAADVVVRYCYDNLLWENDIMRQQLANIGKKFGEKMDDVVPVRHGKWIWVITGQEEWDFHFQCSECEWHEPVGTKFCPNCGAQMNMGAKG